MRDGSITTLTAGDIAAALNDGLYTPWSLAFDAANNAGSKGGLVRFDGAGLVTGAMPDRNIVLDSRYTLGIAIGRP